MEQPFIFLGGRLVLVLMINDHSCLSTQVILRGLHLHLHLECSMRIVQLEKEEEQERAARNSRDLKDHQCTKTLFND